MKTVREILVVEGKYDAIRLASVVQATVVTTGGFRIFHDKKQLNRLRLMARDRGVILLTDSDGAGLVIRNYLQGALPDVCVKHAFIPPIAGKERRKAAPSKEGLLGVEGVDAQTILRALAQAGATFEDTPSPPRSNVTKARLFADGLTGGENSAVYRQRFLRYFDLPPYVSVARMLEWICAALTEEEYAATVKKVREDSSIEKEKP